jgi:hypothetical protein
MAVYGRRPSILDQRIAAFQASNDGGRP